MPGAQSRRADGSASLRRTALRVAPWSLLENAGLSAFMFVTAAILARVIGPTEFGIASMALGLVQLINLGVEALFQDAIVQRSQIEPGHVDTALWTATAIGALLALGIWISAPLIASLFRVEAAGKLAAWASLGLLMSGANGVLTASYRRSLEFKPVALRTIMARVSGAVAALVLAWRGYGAWSLIAQYLISTAVGTARLWMVAERRPGFEVSTQRLRELAGFAFATFLTRITLVANVRLFTVLLGHFLGPVAAGYFGFAVKLLDALWSTLMNAAYDVSLVLFARIQHDRRKLRDAFLQTTQVTALFVVPTFAGLAVCADLIVRVFLGAQWLPAVPVIQLLALSSIIAALRYFAPVVYRAVGRPQLHLVSTSGGILFCIVGLLVLGNEATVLGASLVWAASVLLNVPVSVLLIRKLVGLNVREQFRGLGAPLVSAAITVSVLLAARSAFVDTWPNGVALAIIVGLGALVYGGTLFLIAPAQVRRFTRFVADLRHS